MPKFITPPPPEPQKVYLRKWNPLTEFNQGKAWRHRIDCMYKKLYPNLHKILKRNPDQYE